MAGENTESNVGMLAMVQARDALLRYANQSGKIDPPPEDGPDKDYILKGDAFMAQSKFKDGVDAYLTGLQKKDSALGRRHLARAYFNQAQKVREEVMAAHADLIPKLEDAKANAYVMIGKTRTFNPNDPKLVRYTQEYQNLVRKATDARAHFNAAKREFELVLRAMPDKKDLEASAYIALCLRGIEQIPDAKRSFDALQKDYEPKNPYEQLLYEYGKIEREHIPGT